MTTGTENTETKALTKKADITTLLKSDMVKARFQGILGQKAGAFISSVLTAVSMNKGLKDCDPQSILTAAAIAATLDLPINPSLGFAHIVPYKNYAQFQVGAKGFIQLAMRTGQYLTLNTCEVYEGEITGQNRFTGGFEFGTKKSNKVVGYMGYFKLVNGFEKYYYMTLEEVEKHAQKYSKSYQQKTGVWVDNFHAMALKTVVKLLLSKYGILSTEMQKALQHDQAIVLKENEVEYIDNPQTTEKSTLKQKPAEKTDNTPTTDIMDTTGKILKHSEFSGGTGEKYVRLKLNGSDDYFYVYDNLLWVGINKAVEEDMQITLEYKVIEDKNIVIGIK